MTVKRHYEEVDSNGRRRIVIEEPVTIDEQRDAAVASRREVVRSRGSAADLVRDSIRTVALMLGVVAIALEALLLFRFGFLLGGANAGNGFVDFIYDASGWLVDPFDSIAGRSGAGDGVFDPGTLIAMAVVFTVAFLVILALYAATSMPAPVTERAATTETVYEGRSAHERDEAHRI